MESLSFYEISCDISHVSGALHIILGETIFNIVVISWIGGDDIPTE
jgi:hypothetical protein